MMNVSQKKLSVVIPAYNEEANIASLLRAVLAQRFDTIELIEVLVCSDASSDDTVVQAKTVTDGRLQILVNEKRLGANETQNRLLRQAKGDIIILLNADVALVGEDCLERLASPILHDVTVGIVGARIECLPPRGYLESILAVGHNFRLSLFERVSRAQERVYLCNGRARAFSRAFAEKIIWPDQCPEDNYSYFLCQKLGFSFVYSPESRVQFRLPSTLGDHLKQSHRFSFGQRALEQYFGKERVRQAYALPFGLTFRCGGETMLRSPVRFPLYLLLVLFSRLSRLGRKNEQSRWAIAKSSKQLYVS